MNIREPIHKSRDLFRKKFLSESTHFGKFHALSACSAFIDIAREQYFNRVKYIHSLLSVEIKIL